MYPILLKRRINRGNRERKFSLCKKWDAWEAIGN